MRMQQIGAVGGGSLSLKYYSRRVSLQKQPSISSMTSTTSTNSTVSTSDCSNSSSSSRDSCPIKPIRKKSNRKRVRFQVDEEGKIKEDVVMVKNLYKEANHTKAECFYRRQERKQMESDALLAATAYTINHFESVYALECLLDLGGGCLNASCTDENGNGENLSLLVQREMRGLELLLSHSLRQHKNFAMHSVLKLQKKLQKEEIPFSEISLRLRACYEHVNRATRELAVQLGRADETEARRIYQ